MLFNSLVFCLAFLPATLIGFFLAGRLAGPRAAKLWLIAASAVFYGWWNWRYLFLLGGLTIFNFVSAVQIDRYRLKSRPVAFKILFFGVAGNLAVLGFFKYTNFFLDNLSALTGSEFNLVHIILPLGISFFTFQKIAYLVDSYHGKVDEFRFENFSLFVFFFPQLIAGPIVHHSEFIPQLRKPGFSAWNADYLALGLGIFVIGLFKKVIVADPCGIISDQVFAAVAKDGAPTFFEAWLGSLAYTFQIYFDFSGYTDMAVGLALMVGLKLPENFASPYRAGNIIEFWRRWHMTLSRFLRDYVYIPLGGNRHGEPRRNLNLMLTMLLGGLWHGANWTFVVWGGLHGLFLVVNHVWRRTVIAQNAVLSQLVVYRACAGILTFLCVVVTWVFFRSQRFDAAYRMLKGMAGMNGFALPAGFIQALGLDPKDFGAAPLTALFRNGSETDLWVAVLTVGFAFSIALFGRARQNLSERTLWIAVLLCAGFVIQALAVGTRTEQFIYFQF